VPVPSPVSFASAFGKYLVRHNLQHLIVHVTNHCNFRCEHCFIDFSQKRDLKLAQYRKMGASVGRLFWLDIAGGEPFLRKDLPEIVQAFNTQVLQIPTNGSLPDLAVESLKRMKQLTNAEIAVSLSLDGLPATHERIRKQPGNWNQVWATAERIRALGGIAIKINTVVTNHNVQELVALMKTVRERGPDFHSVILLRGSTLDAGVELPPLDELRRLAPEIFAVLGTYDYAQNPLTARVLRNYHRYLWKVSLRTIEERRQVVPCLAGKFHMVVMGDGRVSSCEMLPPVGDLKNQEWREVMDSKAFKEQVRSIERKECHCTHNCAMLGSILFNPLQLPRLVRQNV
jgi:MoaA/NifB/PqqE/SkfB family radical SAM enzyme